MAAYGIDWRPGDKVVIPSVEFPSNGIAWKSLARFGGSDAQGPARRHHYPRGSVDGRLRPREAQWPMVAGTAAARGNRRKRFSLVAWARRVSVMLY